jgi:predicted enzyme related to lactoylglutathione lyase
VNAARHNRNIDVPIIAHHIHFNVPADQVAVAKDWYAANFGGVRGKRWRYEAVDLPGINLNFSAAVEPLAPTKGRMLDHIGFEVVNLESFCRRLEAAGVKFDRPYSKLPSGLGLAFIEDPWGTTIELTEGLRDL